MRHKKKRPVKFLILSFISFVLLFYLILSFSPDWKLEIARLPAGQGNWKLEILFTFFPLLFLFAFSLFAFLLNNTRRGIFIGLLVVVYLLLRFFHLTNPFFLILLLALLLTLELFFRKN